MSISLEKSREDLKQKELLSGDIVKSGIKSIDSLIGVIKGEKVKERAKQREIEKVRQVDLLKQAQITNLDTELSILL